MILFKTVILISYEQVPTESTVFSLQWERLSDSLFPHVVTSTAHAHFADSFVSLTASASRVTVTAMDSLLCCYCCYNHSGTIKITKDSSVLLWTLSSSHLPLEEGSALLCLRQLSGNSAHDSQWLRHFSDLPHTCEQTLRYMWTLTTPVKSSHICITQLLHWSAVNMSRLLDLPQTCWCITAQDINKMCPGKLWVWYNRPCPRDQDVSTSISSNISSPSLLKKWAVTAPILTWGLGRDFFSPFWERRVIVNTHRAKARLILRPQNKLKLPCQGDCRVQLMLNISPQRITDWKIDCGTALQEHSTPIWCKGRWEMIQMLPQHLWDLTVLLRLPAEQNTKCISPYLTGESSAMGFQVTAVNLHRGEVKCCIRLKQHCHPSSLLWQQLLLYPQLPCTEFISSLGISKGVRHLNRSTDTDLSVYTSCTARSCLWIPTITFPLDHWHDFLLHYMYSFPNGSWWLINYWKHWDKSGINENWNLK